MIRFAFWKGPSGYSVEDTMGTRLMLGCGYKLDAWAMKVEAEYREIFRRCNY